MLKQKNHQMQEQVGTLSIQLEGAGRLKKKNDTLLAKFRQLKKSIAMLQARFLEIRSSPSGGSRSGHPIGSAIRRDEESRTREATDSSAALSQAFTLTQQLLNNAK